MRFFRNHDDFWIDDNPVTNSQLSEFVTATGYVTFAEIAPDPNDYPGALPHMLQPGSLIFRTPPRQAGLRNSMAWWRCIARTSA